jgi:hypothetical protein
LPVVNAAIAMATAAAGPRTLIRTPAGVIGYRLEGRREQLATSDSARVA